MKVVADRASKLLLGVTIVGPEAADLIAEAALALEMGAYLEDVALTIHAHPTLPEAFMEACKVALGEAIHALNRPERTKKGEAGRAGARMTRRDVRTLLVHGSAASSTRTASRSCASAAPPFGSRRRRRPTTSSCSSTRRS